MTEKFDFTILVENLFTRKHNFIVMAEKMILRFYQNFDFKIFVKFFFCRYMLWVLENHNFTTFKNIYLMIIINRKYLFYINSEACFSFLDTNVPFWQLQMLYLNFIFYFKYYRFCIQVQCIGTRRSIQYRRGTWP